MEHARGGIALEEGNTRWLVGVVGIWTAGAENGFVGSARGGSVEVLVGLGIACEDPLAMSSLGSGGMSAAESSGSCEGSLDAGDGGGSTNTGGIAFGAGGRAALNDEGPARALAPLEDAATLRASFSFSLILGLGIPGEFRDVRNFLVAPPVTAKLTFFAFRGDLRGGLDGGSGCNSSPTSSGGSSMGSSGGGIWSTRLTEGVGGSGGNIAGKSASIACTCHDRFSSKNRIRSA